MGYPGYPPNPQPQWGQPQHWGQPQQPVKPSLWWIVPGIVAIIAGIVGAAVFGFSALFQALDEVDDYQRVQSPGSGEVSLTADTDYTIYLEYSGASEYGPQGDVYVTLTDPSGDTVHLTDPKGTTTYQVNAVEGRAGFTFHTEQAGTYLLTGESSARITLAVTEGSPSAAFGTIGIALGIVAAGFVVGLAIIVTVVIMRGRNRKPFGFPTQ
ncbi:hypothetical protein ABZ319_11115 [Nocardia sp. NPDC005978]|uniref:hypothetical protein n=1 Tax=Nocardia sp. NPDC005978 TaxID=3156725 RepID=UPI0033A151B3